MLSVIVPVYNVERYLNQALDCLVNQNIKDTEIILIDDGSSDRSGEICDSFLKKYNFITVFHQNNLGVSSARNRGLENAKGEYIAFFDPDDFIDPGYFDKMLGTLKENNGDIVFSKYKKYYEIDGRSEEICENGFERLKNEHKNLSLFFEYPASKNENRIMGFVWRCVFKKEIIDKNKLRFNEGVAFSEDLLFLLDYLNHAKSSCIADTCGYNYRVRETSATAVSYKKNLFENRKQCLIDFTRIIDENSFLSPADKTALINRIKYTSAKEIIYNEMRFKKDALSTISKYYGEGFSDLFLSEDTLKQAKADKADRVTLTLLALARRKRLSLLKALYSMKYKNEQV